MQSSSAASFITLTIATPIPMVDQLFTNPTPFFHEWLPPSLPSLTWAIGKPTPLFLQVTNILHSYIYVTTNIYGFGVCTRLKISVFKMPSPSGTTQRPNIVSMLSDRWFVYWGSLNFFSRSPFCQGIFFYVPSFAH